MSARRTASRGTWRHRWRRGRTIVRAEGWARFWSMILAELGYHRFLVLERRLDEPVAPIAPGVALTFGALHPAELDAYLRFHDQIPRAEVEARFPRGDECVLARHDGRIVCASWISRDPHFFRSVGCCYPLGPTEVYLYDSFTDPAFRGQAVAPALGVEVLERLRRAGVTRAVMAVVPENRANRRTRAKTGFRVFGLIHYLRIGSRSWHGHRPADAWRDAVP